MTEVLESPTQTVTSEEKSHIVFLNMTGDITITFDEQNAEKIKALVRKKMAEGYQFFTMRKLFVDAIQIKRKIGVKGVDSITSLIIDDDTFERLVKDLNDKDVAELVRAGDASLSKIRRKPGESKSFTAGKIAKTAEEVVAAKSAMAVRKVVGG